jgi:hypothetical protein
MAVFNEFFRNDKLNANNFQFGAHNSKVELRQNQFGGSPGGPIWTAPSFWRRRVLPTASGIGTINAGCSFGLRAGQSWQFL